MRITALALLVAGGLLAVGCTNDEKKKPAPPAVPVTTTQATTKDVPVVLRVVGRGEAYESVSLKPRIDGQVAAVLFTEGQRVKQGDVLIRLDPTDFAARLEQAEAAAARDEALIAKSRTDTARYTALRNRNFVSEEKVNDIRTNEAAATANLRASKAAAELARLQLSYTAIKAPFSGIVGARLVFPGSAVKVNDTIVAVVNRVRPLLVSFSLPEKHLARLRTSLSSGEMKVDVSLPNDPSQRFEGKVIFIDNAVDSTTGTILMKASLPNEDEKLAPGQFLKVSLILDTLKNSVTIPSEAVQQGVDGNFVYVVKEDERVEARKIEIATMIDGQAAVEKGLATGETVVTDGQLRLTPGTKVKIGERGNKDRQDNKTTTASAVK